MIGAEGSFSAHELRDAQTLSNVDSFFGRMGRDGLEGLEEALQLLKSVPLFQAVLDAFPLPVAILDEKGRVVLVNRHWTESQEIDADCAMGRRPGELLGCIHAEEGPGGCGTSRRCERCGAAISLTVSRRTHGQATREYRLARETRSGQETRDLAVTSTAIDLGDRHFTMFVVQGDVGHRLR